jgi:hypothetical protein
MATVPEYLATETVEVSRVPRAGAGIVDVGQGVISASIAGAVKQVAEGVTELAIVEARKQDVRDQVTLAGMKGQLDDFEFLSAPDPDKVKRIQDFPKQQELYAKNWDRKKEALMHGQTQQVKDRFQIYTNLHRKQARTAFANKRIPMESDWAKADLLKQWAIRLKGNVTNPENARKQLHLLIDFYRPYLTSTEEQSFREKVDSSVESFYIHLAISNSPKDAYELVANAKTLDQEQKNQLKNRVDAEIARRERERKLKLQEDREDTYRTVLTNIWNGNLKDPQIVTALTEAGLMDIEDAKSARKTLLNPEPPKTTNEAYIAMMYAKDGIALGTHTREDALKELTRRSNELSPTDGKGFIDDIFGEHDSTNAFWNREAQAYMEKQILEVATMSGILYGSGGQQAMSAKALLAFDQAKKEAAAKGEPIEGRDLLIKAHEVMIPFRQKPIIKGENIPKTLMNLSPQDEIRQSLGLPARTSGQAAIDAFNKGTKYYDPKGILRTR